MKIKLLAGAALAAVAIASGASAREVGWYGAVDAGYHWPMGIDGTSSNNAANGKPYDWTISQAEDWVGFARLGYQVSSHWRVELEGGYRPGEVDSVRGGASNAILGLCAPGVVRTTATPNCGSPVGDLKSITGMGNVIYDILPDSVLNPFIGAGIGINNVKADTIVGLKVIRTIKTEILREGNIYCFTAPEFLGRFYILNQTKFYIDKIANLITWQSWEDIAMGIGNIASIDRKSVV
jgi:opacity protein-like surface antigen